MRRRVVLVAVALGIPMSPLVTDASAMADSKAATKPPVAGVYFPGPNDWEHRTPEQAGLDERLVKDAVAFAVASESHAPRDLALDHALAYGREPFDDPVGPFKERGPATGLIVHHGHIVAEWGEPGRVDLTFSVTKSFLSSVVGVAFDRGLVRDLNEPVRALVPGPHFESEHNAKITWDHLLRQTSDWEGTLWGKPDWADRPEGEPSQWKTRARHEPGTVYKYNDVRVNLLALAALQVWRRPLPEVLKEYVMDPIGASPSWRWYGYENSWVNVDGVMVQSVSGGAHWGGGIWINAYDLARFGYLTLRSGRWKDRQVLSGKWVDMARTPTPAQPTYGFMNWFLNTDRKLLPSAPKSSFHHLGHGANVVYVDPENDLVVVTRWIEDSALDGLIGRVLAALHRTESPLK